MTLHWSLTGSRTIFLSRVSQCRNIYTIDIYTTPQKASKNIQISDRTPDTLPQTAMIHLVEKVQCPVPHTHNSLDRKHHNLRLFLPDNPQHSGQEILQQPCSLPNYLHCIIFTLYYPSTHLHCILPVQSTSSCIKIEKFTCRHYLAGHLTFLISFYQTILPY